MVSKIIGYGLLVIYLLAMISAAIFLLGLIVIKPSMYFFSIDDDYLDSKLGTYAHYLKPLVSKDDVLREPPVDVGTYIKSRAIEDGSQVITSMGDFRVEGSVSGIIGSPVVLQDVHDNRLDPQLCIKSQCYDLIDYIH